MRTSLPIMWPPSTPISAAIFPFLCASRTSAAVRQNVMSFEYFFTFSWTASIWSNAFCTAGGPIVRPSTQMEKKIAFIPPSRMRGISTCPSGLRLPRSNVFEKRRRCVVSSCVSSTIEEKCSLRARSAISSPFVLRTTKTPAHAHATTHSKTRVRRISPPGLKMCDRVYPTSQPNRACFHACRLISASDAVNGNPRLHPLQALKHELSVDRQIAHDRKFRKRLDAYRLLQLIDQRGARHACFAVDQHGT